MAAKSKSSTQPPRKARNARKPGTSYASSIGSRSGSSNARRDRSAASAASAKH